jgi:hypothetical protein
MNKCCEADGLQYLSNPPQNKCKNCGQFWFCKDKSPICHLPPEPKEIEEILKKFDEEMPVGRLSGFVRMTPEYAHSVIKKAYYEGRHYGYEAGKTDSIGELVRNSKGFIESTMITEKAYKLAYAKGFEAGKSEFLKEKWFGETKMDVVVHQTKELEFKMKQFYQDGYWDGMKDMLEKIAKDEGWEESFRHYEDKYLTKEE